ncbi:MAG TPA: hypothetical protein VII38_21255, partial [Polyangia bacterium]
MGARWLVFAAVLMGCNQPSLPVPTDSGSLPNNDGSVPADLAGMSCSDISAAATEWLGEHTTCAVGDQCMWFPNDCGLAGGCAAYYNASAM